MDVTCITKVHYDLDKEKIKLGEILMMEAQQIEEALFL